MKVKDIDDFVEKLTGEHQPLSVELDFPEILSRDELSK